MLNRFEIHSHTEFSNERLIDAINKVPSLVKYAREIGLKGIAITDHESLSCHVEANMLAQDILKEDPEFKLALGNEIYLTDTRESGLKYWHCILIAKDAIGHRQLRILSSYSWLNSYVDRVLERVPTCKKELEDIVRINPGHLVMTTACLGGELSTNVLEMEKARKIGDTVTAEKCKAQIINFVLWAKELMGDDFYFEIAPAANKDQIIVNKKIAELSKVFDVKIVIGSDAHYLTKEDRFVHEAFLNSKQGDREVADFYSFSYLQTEEEIIENLTPSIVDLYEEMCNNSMEIYNKIENYSLSHSQQIPKVDVKDYPKIDLLDPHQSSEDEIFFAEHHPILASMYNSDNKVERYWVNECITNLCNLKGWTTYDLAAFGDKYTDRLEEEADIKRTIGKALDTNMFAYPVTLQHYVDLFWECGSMVGAGRGSSCSGLNHYLLGVTQLDPIEWDLPFWRYLNKERFELGDIDLDLCPSKRPLILQKIKEERGKNINIPDVPDYMLAAFRKELGCTLIATFGTETTRSAIQTACRGYRSDDYPDGIDVDTAMYLSSLVPQERGFLWSLKDVVNGNEEKGRKPVKSFINEVNQYPGLLDVMIGVEGLISKRSSHASGVILFDEDPFEFGCFMKTPNGEVCTQYDLHMAEAAGMTKYDFLVTEVQDKLVQAISFLQEYGEIESDLTLREVYNKYFHPSVLPIDDDKIWDQIDNVKVLDLFQFDSVVGSQAAKKIKPRSMMELSDANGLMRLMTGEDGGEQPIDKYVRFKNNINLWYEEMKKYGLTNEEQENLKPHFLRSHGVPPSQEQLMTMLMDENLCSFSLKDANAARKIVGKKQMNKIPALHEQIDNQAKSPALAKYIWDCGVGPQMGYAFSVIHALAYSFIGFQTAYIATNWNPIYWNTACLVVNSGSLEEQDKETLVSIYAKEDPNAEYEDLPDRSGKKKKEKGTDYSKVAKAIGMIKSKGINVSLVNINTSDYGFKPDVQNNRILYGLKGLSGINADTIETIKGGRPYVGIKDFMNRCKIKKGAIINLIKAGAFDEIDKNFDTREKIMTYFLMNKCDMKKRLTMQNFNGLIQHNLVPKDLELEVRIFNFNKYLKTKKNGLYYIFDEDCIQFYEKFLTDFTDNLEIINGITCIKQKTWEDIYKSFMNIVKEKWLTPFNADILEKYNELLFIETWQNYAAGTTSKWEMDAMSFYHGVHELKDIDRKKYGIARYDEIPIEEIDYFYKRGENQIPIYKLYRIMGTVITKDDSRHSISLLTPEGVVNVKMSGEYYSMFKRQISKVNPDGSKTVIEKSWFRKGEKLICQGFRRGDQFVLKNYKNTGMHELYHIDKVVGDQMSLRHERFTPQGALEEDDYE